MKVHCLIFDGFSDWEPAYILPELRNNSVEIVTLGFTNKAIKSMGGLTITPDLSLQEIKEKEIQTIIIPGGTLWEKGEPEGFLKLIQNLNLRNVSIAAICGATLVLARAGLLNNKKHTSNNLDYLKHVAPEYTGEVHYSNELAVTDGNLITSSGVGSIEFARHLLIKLGIYNQDRATRWYELYKNGKWTGPI
jgi:putative intracellular protease/amidase